MLEYLGVGALVLTALAFSIWWAFDALRSVIAPDAVDHEEIDKRQGNDSPDGREALSERFGKNQHWYDARTGLLGLASLALLAWMIFA